MRLKFSNRLKKNIIKLIQFLLVLIISIEILNYGVLRRILFAKYDVKKYENSQKDNKNKNKNKVMILVHGVYRNHDDLKKIGELYIREGYEVISIQYPSTIDNIEEISRKYIEPVIKSIPKDKEKYFITHSMGTLVIREFLIKNKIENLKNVIFISPPTHGTDLADSFLAQAIKYGLGKAFFELSMKENSFANTLAAPNYKCKVFMGNKSNNYFYSMIIKGQDDGMVPVATAKIENCEYELINGDTHKSILVDKGVIYKTKEFIDKTKG